MITRVKLSSLSTQDFLGYVTFTDISGVAGDGVTDCSAGWVTAMALNVPLFIPPGTFLLTPSTMPANAVVFGTGKSSILKLKSSASGSSGPLLSVSSGVVLKELALDGNKVGQINNTCHGVLAAGNIASCFQDLTIYNTYGDGINISGASTSGIKIINCDIYGFAKTGITVENGVNVLINNTNTYSSDPGANPGDGLAIAPIIGGAVINGVSITDCLSRNNVGRGVAVVGFGSKNVSNVTINGVQTANNNSHGIHLLTTQQVFVAGCVARNNAQDGIRLEGDVQNSRVSESCADTNTVFGIREIVAGSTPNLNGLVYNVAAGNGNNTITKVGASSFVI